MMTTAAARKPAASGDRLRLTRAVKFALDLEKTPTPEEVRRVVEAYKRRVGRA